MKNQFEIEILQLSWLDNIEESQDRCAHGKVFVRIGDEIICNEERGAWTLSSTALYLMRSVNDNYAIGDYGSQLIPCCGHFFMADENDDEFVIIMGCASGIDWTIEHINNGKVKHISESGKEGIISKNEYRELVIKFATQVENFYDQSKPKVIPEDEFDRKGYEAFWNEWKKLKREIEN